jgi:hypothetical protein
MVAGKRDVIRHLTRRISTRCRCHDSVIMLLARLHASCIRLPAIDGQDEELSDLHIRRLLEREQNHAGDVFRL